jgi:hypothetical protein
MSTLATTNIKHPSSASNNIVLDSSGNVVLQAGTASAPALQPTSDPNTGIFFPAADTIAFAEGGSEAMRIDSSSRLLVGTSSSFSAGDAQYGKFQSVGNTFATPGNGIIAIGRSEAATAITANEGLGAIYFTDNAGNPFGLISCLADANAGSGDYPGRLVFFTTADGESIPTERMRITNAGDVLIAKTSLGTATVGTQMKAGGATEITTNNDRGLLINRKGSDGQLVAFDQDDITEGSISVSGTTVSYNGAHLSRWSQLPGGAEREEILRGTVLTNIDEMCNWGEEDNEQLNRMQVSDVEGDPNVSGVFQAWDDDDDTYTDDFYCAMTGDFIIRIAEGTTVQRGDLLMSAGDGTAKPQDDDIIRSKTIAKVTSTHVTCTYDDDSYCVPCVLMAC